VQPDFADAWNNLAQTRLDLADLAGAQLAIERAVAAGGVHLERYLTLQRKIATAFQD
jgi:hypothetical protein